MSADTCELTPGQRRVLDAIVELQSERQTPPTIREIARRAGLRSNNGVVCHLHPLAAKGYIEWTPQTSRSIRVLKHPDGYSFDVTRTPAGIRVSLPGRPLTDEEAQLLAGLLLVATEDER